MHRVTLTLFLLVATVLAEEGWVTHALALSPDLKTIVRGRMHAEKGTQRLWIHDAKTGETRIDRAGDGPVRAFAFRADSARFVSTNDHGPLRIVDAANGKIVANLAGHRGWVYTIALAGKHVASAGRDNTLRFWDAESETELWRKSDIRVGTLALSPDGKRLATTDQFGKLILWDTATGKPLRELDTGDNRWGFVVAFSRDGTRVAAGQKRLRVFEVKSGKTLATIDLGEKRATAIAFSGDASRLATADRAHGIRLWRITDVMAERTWKVKDGIGALVFSGDGRTLCAALYSGSGRYWDMSSGTELTGSRATGAK